jgi:enoyl-CoA hydratase/carnithine racemase
MSSLVLRNDDKDGRCTLTLNRPDALNALNTALFEELDAHLDDIAAKTATIGCVVIRGAGRSFCAGADLKDISSGKAATAVPNFKPKVVEKLARLPQPVVAQVHGHCYTGGVELVLACDLIVAAESARFADTHGKWGLVGAWGLTQRLPRKIGAAKAKEMMFTALTYSAKQAEAMGLINSCVPDDKLEAEVDALVAAILATSWHSNFGNKRLLIQTAALPLDAGLAYEIYNHPGRAPDLQDRLGNFAKKS